MTTIDASLNTRDTKFQTRMVRLGDHVTRIGSGVTPRGGESSYVEAGVPLIRSMNVHLNRFKPRGLAFITAEQDRTMEVSRVNVDDVLLNITGASIGRVCVVPAALVPANVNQHVAVIRSDGSWIPEFLSFYISTPSFQRQILADQAGATRQALTKALIEDFEFPLPAADEQRRIVAELTAAFKAVDRARRAAGEQLAAAEALPAAYLREVFEGPDAKSWKNVRLAEICELLPSKSITTNGDAQVTAITTACLSESGFRPDGVKSARMRSLDVDACRVRTGEVLIARSNTPDLVGRVSLYAGDPPEIVASDLTIRLWPRSGLTGRFLTSYLSFMYLAGYWKTRAGGASGSMKKITRKQISDQTVPLPSPQAQDSIVADIEARLNSANLLRQQCIEELAAINALPSAYLRQAFQGLK